MKRSIRSALVAVALSSTLVATGCGALGADDAVPQPYPSSGLATPEGSAGPAGQTSRTPGKDEQNDLKTKKVERVLRSGDLTINVVYSTPLDTSKWTSTRPKPLVVSLSAINNSQQTQKIYLSKTTVNLGLSDGEGALDAPKSISDTAGISPGYIVNFPYSYDQNFLIPAVDDSAIQLTLDLNYELLVQVEPKSKDYAKQTASDTIVVPLT